MGIAAKGWLDVVIFGYLHRCAFVSAVDFQFGFLLLTSSLYFYLGIVSVLEVRIYANLQQYLPAVHQRMQHFDNKIVIYKNDFI